MVIPRTVGRYEILDAIGGGGMGTVYRAFDPALERQVALKIVHLDRIPDVAPELLSERFRREARAVARLNHPAIVTIFDYDDQDPAGAFIAMEYIQGCALDQYVKQRPELHLEDAVSAMLQVLGGLAYAHGKDVVHRDIKPSNLLVTRDGFVKITDFGIAKMGPRTQTQTGYLMGTPQYMAPEQWKGGVVDHRCDLHAAGAVLYELLAGSPPFQGTTAEIMYKICNEPPKPLSAADPTIPKEFDEIVAKALEKEPADRYASAAEFHQALRASWQGVSRKPPSPTLSQSARLIAGAISRHTAAARRARAGTSPAAKPPPVSPAPAPHPFKAAMEAVSKSQPASETGEDQSLAGWSREQLFEIERQLAALIGPVAEILVRDAAATTASKQELYQLLASHLPNPEQRRRFLLGSEPVATVTAPDVKEARVMYGPGTGRPLTPEAIQRACQLAVRYLGPIAEVATKKAAQTAADEAQLYSLLAEKVTNAAERERFLIEAGRPH
jgi:serine/threonine protein kinase